MSDFPEISVRQLEQISQSGKIDLIDVRTSAEHQALHISIAKLVPLDQLDPLLVMKERSNSENEPLYVICKKGPRGVSAQQKFAEAGFMNIVNVDGGIDGWAAAGFPVVRSNNGISLERQVRIAAGFIVLTAALAALFTGNLYFVVISTFVGAGLMFAGITDTCGMGMLLAKMPWNK
ncbi:UNVERIFIED_CONTAM: hypothetical protein GTU68_004163 [Idotea baltica]|nr:hypothetical protein [Idotea baltica]